MDNKRVFRTSLGGFNKEDVSRYIGELGRKVDAAVGDCTKAEEKAAIAQKELAAVTAESSDLSVQLENLKAEYATLQEMNVAMTEKSRTHYEDKVKAAKESNALYARIAELEGEMPVLIERAERYERNAIHIADAMISAREESERIINKAVNTASEIRIQLSAEINKVGDEAEKIDREYLRIRDDTYSCTEKLHSVLDSLCIELEGVRGRLSELKRAAEIK